MLGDFEPRREDTDFRCSSFCILKSGGCQDEGDHSVHNTLHAFQPFMTAGDGSSGWIVPVNKVGGEELAMLCVGLTESVFGC